MNIRFVFVLYFLLVFVTSGFSFEQDFNPKENLTVGDRAVLSIKADGLTIDNKFGKRQNYYSHTDYAQREYGNERDQKIRKQALKRADFKCELIDCDRCDFCANLTQQQRDTIEVHHIDELHDNPTNNDNLDNLVAICNRLHRRYHYHMDEEEQAKTKQRFINVRNVRYYE